MGIPEHLICLLRNLYAGQVATVSTIYGTTDWFKIGKGVCYGCIFSPCLFNFYAEYIKWNVRLDKSQAVIKIAGGKIKKSQTWGWKYTNGRKRRVTKILLMKVKEESEKSGLTLSVQKKKKKRSWHLVPSLHGKYMGKRLKQWQTLFFWAPKSLQMVIEAMKSKDACLLE